MWWDPNLAAPCSFLLFWKSVFLICDMLWELCSLWNIWVCSGKQQDALQNQTGDSRTEPHLEGPWAPGQVGNCSFSFCCLLTSGTGNWGALLDHVAVEFPAKIKEDKFQAWSYFPQRKTNAHMRCSCLVFSFFFWFGLDSLVWITIWCLCPHDVSFHVMEQICFSP